ncbi:MAG: hypothetical protein M1832_000364, partial [Thelocarpon impressellum]
THAARAARGQPAVRDVLGRDQGVAALVPPVRKAVAHIVSLSLLALDAMRDYDMTERLLPERIHIDGPDKALFKERYDFLRHRADRWRHRLRRGTVLFEREQMLGSIVPDEFFHPAEPQFERDEHDSVVRHLNDGLFARCKPAGATRPRIRVERGQGGGLHVMAAQGIPAGAVIHEEIPAVRAYLQPLNNGNDVFPSERLRDHVRHADDDLDATAVVRRGGAYTCDNCKRVVPLAQVKALRSRTARLAGTECARKSRLLCPCLFQDPMTVFCAGTFQPGPVAGRRRGAGEQGGRGRARRRRRGDDDAAYVPPSDDDDHGAGHDDDHGAGDNDDEPAGTGRSCLDVARQTYHRRACGRDWNWLHAGMQDDGARRHATHNTYLALLFRDVVELTLRTRAAPRDAGGDPHRHAHEIDALLPLSAEPSAPSGAFTFGWAANIVTPFDVLDALGVDIFRDPSFDTWVLQLVLRKLELNLLPWDPSGANIWAQYEGDGAHAPGLHGPELDLDAPLFSHLSLHPGYALMQQGCRNTANARWTFSHAQDGVPNKLLVTARRPIARHEEIVTLHLPPILQRDDEDGSLLQRRRGLGRWGECRCSSCVTQRNDEEDFVYSEVEMEASRREAHDEVWMQQRRADDMAMRAAARTHDARTPEASPRPTEAIRPLSIPRAEAA